MSKSIRFLGMAILAWAGVRAVSLGVVPGSQALAFEASSARPRPDLPPIVPTALPAIGPVGAADYGEPGLGTSGPTYPAPPNAGYAAYAPYPVYIPVPTGQRMPSPPQVIQVNHPFSEPRYGDRYAAAFDDRAELPELAFALPAPVPALRSTPVFEKPRILPGLDRLSLTGWALMRNKGGPDSLANSGTLGGSEAGARLMWRHSSRLSASLRASAPVNSQRGAETALGIRYQPLTDLPIAFTLERRHRFKEYGRNAFAIFTEGGVYGRPMPWQSTLDGYFQGGIVDFNNPDWFVDGQLSVTRPVWRNLSAGVGMWGGAQPGLYRFDVGPRLSLNLGRGMRAHVDYRLSIAGNAKPGSGTAVTLAGDF